MLQGCCSDGVSQRPTCHPGPAFGILDDMATERSGNGWDDRPASAILPQRRALASGRRRRRGPDGKDWRVFDEGRGHPLVVVPGLHGRWEWAETTLAHLSARCRTISYSLCGDVGSGGRFDPELGFDNYVRQLDAVLDAAGVGQAAVCGVSFGGLIALRYAALRPGRVTSLILASTPGPGFEPSSQQARWLARPWLSAPAFVLTTPVRIGPELLRSIPDRVDRVRFLVKQGLRCASAPMVPSRMASRMRSASAVDFLADCRRISRPTLVVTGEDGLDRVVPVASTRSFVSLIAGASYRVIEGTGHMGSLTQPDRFASVISEFIDANHQ